jgi:hypothetical protein
LWARRALESRAPVPPAPPPAGVLAAIPGGALLVATVDVTALRRTPLGERLLGGGRAVPGLGDVATVCGGDPTAAVEEAALAVPATAIDAGFGLFASGPIDAEALLRCAERVMKDRGGRPERVDAGRFALVRDLAGTGAGAELAVAQGGPVILAEAPYVRRALDLGDRGSIADDRAHAELRALVEPGVLTATVVLGDEQLRALEAELASQGADGSPLRALRGAALSVRVDGALSVHGVARCDEAAGCRDLGVSIEDALRKEAARPTARAIGLGPVLEALEVEATGAAVHLRATVPLGRAADILERILVLQQIGRALEAPPPTTTAAPR